MMRASTRPWPMTLIAAFGARRGEMCSQQSMPSRPPTGPFARSLDPAWPMTTITRSRKRETSLPVTINGDGASRGDPRYPAVDLRFGELPRGRDDQGRERCLQPPGRPPRADRRQRSRAGMALAIPDLFDIEM